MPKDFLENSSNLLFKEQKTILSAASVIGFLTFLAAILGLIKVRLYAGIVGVGAEFDTFVAAFKIPDFIYSLIVLGALNAAFIPIFSELIAKKEKSSAWKFASNLLNTVLLIFVLTSLLVYAFARPLSTLVGAGFSPEQVSTLVGLLRIMILSPILLGVSSFISGSIQSFRRFLVPFLAPVVYNLGGIFGVLFLYHPFGIYGLAWGVVLGSFFHLLIQLPLLGYLGFRYLPILDFKDQVLRKTVQLSLPRTIGLASEQIKAVLIISLASLLQSGSISILRFAESIFTVPISVIGASIAQASLPTLSWESSHNDLARFKKTFTASLLQILFLVVPITVVLIFLKIPVVRLVLGVGRFNWTDTILVSWVLALLSVALPAQAVSHLLVRAFYALKNTQTPVLIGVLSVVFSLGLAVVLLPFYQIRGIALAVSLGAILEVLLLILALHQKINFDLQKILPAVFKIFLAGSAMAICVYVPYKILDKEFLDTQRVVNLLILVWLVLSFGGSVYLVLSWILGLAEIRIFIKFLWKLRNLRETLTSLGKLPSFDQSHLLEESIES